MVTITDSVDVENIEVRSGKYTFATDYDGTLSLNNDLIIGGSGSGKTGGYIYETN